MFDVTKFELRVATPAELAAAWSLMVGEGKLHRCFPAASGMGRDRFVERLTVGSWSYIGIYDGKPAGLAWINHFEQKTARLAFCAFGASRWVLLPLIAESAGRLIRLRGADGKYCFNALLGYIRPDNRLSVKVALSVGFRPAGLIPGYYPDGADAEIYALTRSDDDAKKEMA